VLLRIADDLNTDQLMARLFIERGSVNKHNLGTKLSLKGRDSVNKYARRHRETLRAWYPLLCRKPNPTLFNSPAPPPA
jgi:hypothetical protein